MSPDELQEYVWECRGCTAAVVTAYSVYGRRMTIDTVPKERGNIVLGLERNPGEKKAYLTARVYVHPDQKEVLFDVDPPPEYLYVDHHVVCPVAARFRSS